MAERFQVQDRGYIREGYFADLVLLDLGKPYVVNDSNLLYLCGWSPFNGYRFHSTVEMTLVNGQIAWQKARSPTRCWASGSPSPADPSCICAVTTAPSQATHPGGLSFTAAHGPAMSGFSAIGGTLSADCSQSRRTIPEWNFHC